MEMYKKLPDDIINIILLYVGNFRYRNGKFISQIAKCDKRYEILKTITKPKCSFQKNGIISYTIFFSNNVYLSLYHWPDNKICYFVDRPNTDFDKTRMRNFVCYDRL